MAVVTNEELIDCASAVPAIWDHLSDTDRLNWAAGLQRLHLTPLSSSSAARFVARTRLAGLHVSYEEEPYEWIHHESFRVKRRMLNGPAKQLEMSYLLAPTPAGGTRVTLRLVIEARAALFAPFIKLSAWRSLRALARQVRRIDAASVAGRAPHRRLPKVNLAALETARQELLRVHQEPTVQALCAHVREEDPIAVARIRPYALADAWGQERRAVLAACLDATDIELLCIQWDIICPSCRTAARRVPALDDVGEHESCQLCEIRFAAHLDDAIELTFRPHPRIRGAEAGPFCIGGPRRMPHVLVQSIIEAAQSTTMQLPAESGDYRLFVRGGATTTVRITPGAASDISARTDNLNNATPLFAAPEAGLLISNPTANALHVKLERAAWGTQAASARDILTVPLFRKHLPRIITRPGAVLKFARLGIMAGQLRAGLLSPDEVAHVKTHVEASDGTLVQNGNGKVLAIFASSPDALRAAMALLEGHTARHAAGTWHLGVAVGPCASISGVQGQTYVGEAVEQAEALSARAESGNIAAPGSVFEGFSVKSEGWKLVPSAAAEGGAVSFLQHRA